MEVERLLIRLESLSRWARRIKSEYEQEEFLQYCSLRFLEGRALNTKTEWLYFDFLRHLYGPVDGVRCYWQQEIRVGENIDRLQDHSLNELDVLGKVDSDLRIAHAGKILTQAELLIYVCFYEQGFTHVEIAEALGVTPSAVSLRVKKITGKLARSKSFVADLVNAV